MLRLAIGILGLTTGSVTAQFTASIATGSGPVPVAAQPSSSRSLAAAPDGTLWAIVGEAANDLVLYQSADSGVSWSRSAAGATPTVGDISGAIAFGAECTLLHVAWTATNGSALRDAYYATYDTRLGTWSAPQRLTNASAPSDQYDAGDLVVTEQGTVAITIATDSAPPSPIWSGGHAVGIRVQPLGGTFSPVVQVNTDSGGRFPSAAAIGEIVHMSFRTSTGSNGIRYRAFDTASQQFLTPADAQIETGTSNVSCIAADLSDALYIVYSTGGTNPGTGLIRAAYAWAGPGAPSTWSLQTVVPDSDLVRGDISYSHYSLTAPFVGVVYSRLTIEQYRNVFIRPANNGSLLFDRPLWTSVTSNEYAVVSGLREARALTIPLVVTESRAPLGNRVDFIGNATQGRVVRSGRSCAGTSSATPSFGARFVPARVSVPYFYAGLEVQGMPTLQPGVIWFGVDCLPTPLALDGIGMPGCTLQQNPIASATTLSDQLGALYPVLRIVPNTTLARLPVTLQAATLAPGANPLGVLVTNSVTLWIP